VYWSGFEFGHGAAPLFKGVEEAGGTKVDHFEVVEVGDRVSFR
jgi:hypothetical protein